jgi:hypothetical protein
VDPSTALARVVTRVSAVRRRWRCPRPRLVMVMLGLEALTQYAVQSVDSSFMDEDTRIMIGAGKPIPISTGVVQKQNKTFVDATSGEMLVLEVLKKGEKCALTWAALVALCDHAGRIVVRGVKGSTLSSACKWARVDLAVEMGRPGTQPDVDALAAARAEALRGVAMPIDQALRGPGAPALCLVGGVYI